MAQDVRIGVLGLGTVGSSLLELIDQQHQEISDRSGVNLTVTRVAVRTVTTERQNLVPDATFTTDPMEVVTADDVDIVVELMGGLDPAGAVITAALERGKPVVTANKALIADQAATLFALADKNEVDFSFEAAVGGAIPIIEPLRTSLAGEKITAVVGIVNGTTNFILTRMTEQGSDFQTALSEAQRLGFAEADPTADVSGSDAAAKAAILSMLAFGVNMAPEHVHCEGITTISADDIAYATRRGYVIKLVAIAERLDSGTVSARVHPAMLPHTHPLAAVREAYNAVFIHGEAAGELMFYGPGAGGAPTASAVLGNIVGTARNLAQNTFESIGTLSERAPVPLSELASAFYIDVEVKDQPGVLAAVATEFADFGVSIESMEQFVTGHEDQAVARIVFITHRVPEAAMNATLTAMASLDTVIGIKSVIRVRTEDTEDPVAGADSKNSNANNSN